MRRYLGPRIELTNTDTGLNWTSSVRPVDSHHLADDKLSLKCRLAAELCHILDEPFDARQHYATGALWRIEMNRASLTMETISLS